MTIRLPIQSSFFAMPFKEREIITLQKEASSLVLYTEKRSSLSTPLWSLVRCNRYLPSFYPPLLVGSGCRVAGVWKLLGSLGLTIKVSSFCRNKEFFWTFHKKVFLVRQARFLMTNYVAMGTAGANLCKLVQFLRTVNVPNWRYL